MIKLTYTGRCFGECELGGKDGGGGAGRRKVSGTNCSLKCIKYLGRD